MLAETQVHFWGLITSTCQCHQVIIPDLYNSTMNVSLLLYSYCHDLYIQSIQMKSQSYFISFLLGLFSFRYSFGSLIQNFYFLFHIKYFFLLQNAQLHIVIISLASSLVFTLYDWFPSSPIKSYLFITFTCNKLKHLKLILTSVQILKL